MRYRFKGVVNQTGKPVEGHVHAPEKSVALQVLGNNGIACRELIDDPAPEDFISTTGGTIADPAMPPYPGAPVADYSDAPAPPDEVSSAIDSALDTASSQVDFDKLADKFKGKRVWVLDRGKIRDRVKAVVARAIEESLGGAPGAGGDKDRLEEAKTLEKINDAIDKMFADKRNVSTQTGPEGLAVEEQIARLSAVVRKVEGSIAQLSAMMRRGAVGGGGGGQLAYDVPRDDKHDKVLLEIFETNVELQRTISEKQEADAG